MYHNYAQFRTYVSAATWETWISRTLLVLSYWYRTLFFTFTVLMVEKLVKKQFLSPQFFHESCSSKLGPNFRHPTFMLKVDNFESSESGNKSSPEWRFDTLHNRHTNRKHHLRQQYCCRPIVIPSWQWTSWWDNRFTHWHALLQSDKEPLTVAPKPLPTALLMASLTQRDYSDFNKRSHEEFEGVVSEFL
jgi:hypothetical protein